MSKHPIFILPFPLFSVTFFSHGETIPGEEVTLFMSTTTDHSRDNIIRLLQEALAVTILLENDVQTQQSDSIEALSLGIIHSKLSETTKLLSEFFQKEL